MNRSTSHSDPEKVPPSPAALFANHDVDSLAWHNLSVTVKDRSTGDAKTILADATGIARPGQILALIGPSGCGKTTLLNTLAQRQTEKVTGKVVINGGQVSLATHRAISSFVEQEDALIGSLNVEESLYFAARLALPPSVTRPDARERVQQLIDAFGLDGQRHTLIGTPLQKGISGGQKRRVSVAMQLITGPRILYLDEPTSGLDSTASHEVISFIQQVARQCNLIVVASIHQPSTKTFDLFDHVLLLSRGRTCYNGPVAALPAHFADMGLAVPPLMNPAEHVLDLTNLDFAVQDPDRRQRLDGIFNAWSQSDAARDLDHTVSTLVPADVRLGDTAQHPSMPAQILTLLHRAGIKSYRDYVAYWVRVAMYLGLAIMMGTVWLRLGSDQRNIQPFINGIFFGSAFMSFMAVAYVPAFLEDRATFVKERANGLYGATAFIVSNFLIGLPYLFGISLLFSVVAYWLSNFQPTASAFFTWVMWLFLDLLAAESLVVLVASIVPNFVISLAIIAFANGLWMSVGGFLVTLPVLNVFWKYVFHYIDYQAYVFQGMMVNEFRNRSYRCAPAAASDGSGTSCHCMFPSALQSQCRIAGTAVLDEYGYALGRQGRWVGILVAIVVGYRLAGWGVNAVKKG